ncbi:hypothetical protein BVX94_01200 [bacterium B17]|nr:hypothetical protein BVX94_01200 [bacterium B17]
MPKYFLTISIIALLSCVSGSVNAVKLDVNGCRVLNKLPKQGVHPRVFFTEDEYPLMRKRLNAPKYKEKMDVVIRQAVESAKKNWGEFAELDLSNPTDEQILKYFKSGEGRNQQWGLLSVWAVLEKDTELKQFMAKVITNYGRIILASKERTIDGPLKFKIWKKNSFDVGVSWTLGSAGYPVAYDVLYNSMSKEQRTIVRDAIAAATKGRKSYGNGMPRGYAASNHYGYHGDLLVMLCAIEGEEGFDKKTYDGIVQVLLDYWDVGFTKAGACHEDGYGPNLGLRAGSRGFLALARRGHNIFKTEKYRNYLKYVVQEWEPFPGGMFMGGASGGPYGEFYPSSFLIARYMYPESIEANYNLRHVMGDEYERRFRWQGFLDYLLFGTAWKGSVSRETMLKKAKLPLSVFYPVRGKIVARSDWSSDALYATFDARPDAHMIGHDKVDRGNFSLSALGRMWAFTGDFHDYDLSTENSLVHIDGKAQAWKAPAVRMLWNSDDGRVAGAAADLKYAYDWEWTPPWPKMSKKFSPLWEPEKNGPLDLGWPEENRTAELPDSINGSETGYAHKNNLHKRPYNVVEKAQRTFFLVRGKHPYVLICDDIKKDDKERLYEWYMQLPLDVKIISNKGNETVLGDETGKRYLLVRFLQKAKCEARVEDYMAREPKKNKKKPGMVPGLKARRLIGAVNAVEPEFRVMLYPFRKGDKMPRIREKGGTYGIGIGTQTHILRNDSGKWMVGGMR